jgi:putative ABC transport system ATP-binding protein
VLQQRNRERATTVVIVTHNTAITAMADRVVRLRSGSIVEDTRNDAPCDAAEVTW